MHATYEDLFDLGKRAGAGVTLWHQAVERQLSRVRDANYRHRLHHSQNDDERREDAGATAELHADVYFLALAIRRLLLFSDALAELVDDPRLDKALATFHQTAPHAKDLRNLFEHVNEYLVDSPKKRVKFPGRASPMLRSRWDCDNVIVAFGPLSVDITLTAVAAIELGRVTETLWDEHLTRARPEYPHATPEAGLRMLDVEMAPSSIIGGDDEGYQVGIGILREVRVREATAEERADEGS